MTDIGVVSDKATIKAHEGLNFTDVLRSGEKASAAATPKAQGLVDSHFGSSSITKQHIEIAGIQQVPLWNNGCMFVHGGNAEAEIGRQKYDATLALNQQTPPGAERARPGKEQQVADQVSHIIDAPDSQYGNSYPDDKGTKVRELFKNLSREETERVINSLNDKMAQSGFKFAQTGDGGVWTGQKKEDGTYEPWDIIRYPECTVS